jgi:hypothetical protein
VRSTCAAKPEDACLVHLPQAGLLHQTVIWRAASASKTPHKIGAADLAPNPPFGEIALTRHAVPNGCGLLPLTGMSPCCAMPRHAERARAQPEPTAGTARRARRPNGGQRQRPAEPDGGETGAHGGGPAESGNAARRARDGRRRRRSSCPRSVPDAFGG